jgi:hypothetical protein
VGLHGHVYAISEMPDEENISKKINNQNNSIPKVIPKSNGQHESIDKLFIHTSLDDIQDGIDKKEFKNLGFKVEKLKTLIHKAGFWDSFTKTDEFKKLNKMNLTIRTQILNLRRN